MFKHCLLAATLLASLMPIPSVASPTPQNTISILAPFEFSSLDPTRRGYIFTRMQVLETLLNVDAQGQLVPGLAVEWQLLDHGKIWELKLRKGVVFHDGEPLTAEAVVKSLNIARTKPGMMQGVPIVEVVAVDHERVRVVLSEPFRPLGAILANYAASILSPAAFSRENEVVALIGTGPYAAYQVSIPHKLVVEKFDSYWGKKADIDYASYLTGHRVEARVLQARSGQADIVFGLDPAAVPMLKRLPALEVIRSDLPRSLALKLNSGDPLLADQSVRGALSRAINRQGIATAILRSPESATSQLLPSYMSDWYVPQTESAYQPEKAAQQLKQLGWQPGKDGWLEKDGQRFELTLLTYADRPELTPVATAIQDQWQKIGVKLNVHVTSSSSIPAGHKDGSLQAALIARNYGTIADPLGIMVKDFGQESGGDWGSMNWANPEIQATLKQLLQETDSTRYHQNAQQVAQAIYQEKPMIAIAYYVQHTAVNARLDGFRFDPYERSFFLNELTWANQ